MIEALHRTVIEEGRPFLGICVGMQLMAASAASMASIRTRLDRGRGRGSAGRSAGLKIPHMGWNDLAMAREASDTGRHHARRARLFRALLRLSPADPATVLATVEYGGPVVAVIGRDNLVGTPVPSGEEPGDGLRLIANFLGGGRDLLSPPST